jgi:F-type H+-transporting ATPase subunit epsilon
MTDFTLHLLAADATEIINNVVSFSAEDASGSFSLLARHERFMTTLAFGLARLRLADGTEEYLGLPGGLLYFSDNTMSISTRRYLRDTDAENIARTLSHELLEEEQALEETRRSLRHLEAEMLNHLLQLGGR